MAIYVFFFVVVSVEIHGPKARSFNHDHVEISVKKKTGHVMNSTH